MGQFVPFARGIQAVAVEDDQQGTIYTKQLKNVTSRTPSIYRARPNKYLNG